MKIAYILHTLYGKLGAIRDWAIQNQHELTKIHLFDNSPSPSPQDYDLLISMGGPQRLTSGVIHDYLLKEIEVIKQFIAHDKQVIGVCLGAQLIAHAMGATTEYSPIKEIGLHEIIFNEKGKAHPIFSCLESPVTTMHWHFDMPGLPPQAKVLAYTDHCPRQIIQFSPKVYGFQCHLEATGETAQMIANNYPHQLTNQNFQNTLQQIREYDFMKANQFLIQFLNHFTNNKNKC